MIHQARVSGCRNSLGIASGIFIASGVAIGGMAGVILGVVGAQLGDELRAIITGLATAAVIGAALRHSRPWQLNRDTARSWLEYHDARTAALNGAELSVGLATRIGYWLWYAIPIGVFASGSATVGLLVCGSYALTRLGLSVVLAWVSLERSTLAESVRSVARAGAPLYAGGFYVVLAAIVIDEARPLVG